MTSRDEMLAAARDQIRQCAPAEALAMFRDGAFLVDVREQAERESGAPEGSLHLPLSTLERDAAATLPELGRCVLLICSAGGRSLLAAQALQRLGYADARSVAGGFQAWQREGLPLAPTPLDADGMARYARHLQLPQVGIEGQQRLDRARVLVIGAGGLGSPALFYLAAAGVGTLGIVDDDVVDRSNLQRQILHADARVGMAKIDSAAITIAGLNPCVVLELHRTRLDAENVERLIAAYDIIVDGSDNLVTRYILSDACVRLGKPWVHAAVHQFDGQVTVFAAGLRRGESPCYRCLFPDLPGPDAAPNCAEAGVLGVLPGLMGMLQATEVVKWLLGIGTSLDGRLLSVDALGMRFRETRVRVDPDCRGCSQHASQPQPQVPAVRCATDLP